MTKDELNSMFQENVNRSCEAPPELRETIKNINSMTYKLCGTMMVNCGDSSQLTNAIRQVHQASLCFQDALTKLAQEEVNAQ
jgi:hypothetical protein